MLEHKRITPFALVAVLCILSGGLETQAVTTSSDLFPLQGGTYELQGPVTYPGASIPGSIIDIELVSMSLVQKPDSAKPPVNPPPDGDTYAVDSFFDITVRFNVDGASDYAVDSFFDIPTGLSIDNPPGGSSPQFTIEILSMDLVSDPMFMSIPGTSNTLEIRPILPSTGGHTITDIGSGQYEIDSFFDVFTELRVDNGPWTPASGPIRLDLIPEPATLSLLALGGLAMIRCKRK